MAAQPPRPDTSKPETSATARSRRLIPWITIPLALIAVVAYQLHLGGGIKRIEVPHAFNIDMVDRPRTQPPPRPVASRDFVLGRWQVEQNVGGLSGGTVADYERDGTVSGTSTTFAGGRGVKQDVHGEWRFEKLGDDAFRLSVAFDNGATFRGRFHIIDQDHIQNTDDNYVAVRVR